MFGYSFGTSLFLAKALMSRPVAANTNILSAAKQVISSGRLLPGQQHHDFITVHHNRTANQREIK